MSGWAVWLAVVLGMVWGLGVEARAAMYLWTDERGVVHMTNQWANVPESAHSRVSVRESSAVPSEGTLATEQAPRAGEPPTVKHPSLQTAPDLGQMPPPDVPAPSIGAYPRESFAPIPRHRPFVHVPRKLSPPFPYNVRLDPFDPDFVWVGPNRVPKDTFSYPRVSLDQQTRFSDRIRALEQRRAVRQKTFRAKPIRP